MSCDVQDKMEAAYQVARVTNPVIQQMERIAGPEAARHVYCTGWANGHLQALQFAQQRMDSIT